jgi:hypothetical protein
LKVTSLHSGLQLHFWEGKKAFQMTPSKYYVQSPETTVLITAQRNAASNSQKQGVKVALLEGVSSG